MTLKKIYYSICSAVVFSVLIVKEKNVRKLYFDFGAFSFLIKFLIRFISKKKKIESNVM